MLKNKIIAGAINSIISFCLITGLVIVSIVWAQNASDSNTSKDTIDNVKSDILTYLVSLILLSALLIMSFSFGLNTCLKIIKGGLSNSKESKRVAISFAILGGFVFGIIFSGIWLTKNKG